MSNWLSTQIARLRFRASIIRPWEDTEFTRVLREGRNRLDPQRNFVLQQFLRYALPLTGDVAEFGVYKGGTAWLLAQSMTDSGKGLHLYDTFAGSPAGTKHDFADRKVFYRDANLDSIRERFKPYPFTVFHPGLLPGTLSSAQFDRLCFAHFHLNLYQSTRQTLAAIHARMTSGGVILIEDYGIKQCAGVRRAVDEFCEGQDLKLVYLPTCQGVIIV
ncbi:MAG: TylF/MycF family methyltransferase [Candidatus Cloacimonetes bacterium]|nr:TylF/MycF family methyltransferase [Candidatus Cloacimonadota bacterium]